MSKRILLCDDEIHIVRAAEVKFRRQGYEVTCASDGLSAWQAIEAEKPDLLITDFQMPCLDGGQLCERIRAHAATVDLPIFMLTAKGYEMTFDEVAGRWGVLALVTKPFSPRELVHMAEQFFATGQAPRQALTAQ